MQLVQGREKVLEGKSPDEMLELFARFPQIQVIDLDAAMGKGSNSGIMEHLVRRATIRAGGGIRTVERARELAEQGAHRVIIGTAALTSTGPNFDFLSGLQTAVGTSQITIALDSRNGRIVVKGWQQLTPWMAVDLIAELEPYCSGFLCTYVDKEGMMQGTDLCWFETLRKRTRHELVAAGGITTLEDVQALSSLDIHCAIGMSIYTGRLGLDELADLNEQLMTSRNCH